MYFYKISESNKSLISTDKPLSELTTTSKKIGSRTMEIRQQGVSDVKFGFTAISAEDGMALRAELKVGDELPLTLTEKKVVNQQTNQAFDNLYWAE